MADEDWQTRFEQAWEFREGVLYPRYFGPERRGISCYQESYSLEFSARTRMTLDGSLMG